MYMAVTTSNENSTDLLERKRIRSKSTVIMNDFAIMKNQF